MSDMLSYAIGLVGMWIVCDGIISIRLYLKAKDETGKKTQNWKYDHSIRLARICCGIFLMIAGALAAKINEKNKGSKRAIQFEKTTGDERARCSE